jgi:hypothetical protein
LLTLHRLAGSARDFDEEKRRLDQELWRCLAALAGALGISLTGPEGTLEGLCRGIVSVGGQVSINPIFQV